MAKLNTSEWKNYLQAFDAYVEARRRGEDARAESARMVMGYFASQRIPEGIGARPQPQGESRKDLFLLLDQLDLL